jgi:hypothetical protein
MPMHSCGGLETRRLFMSGGIARFTDDAAHDHTASGAVVRAVQRRDCSASSWIPAGVSVTPLNCSHDGITLSTHNHSMRGGMSSHLNRGTRPRIEDRRHQEGGLSSSHGTAPDIQRRGAYEAPKFGNAGSTMNGPRLSQQVVEAVEELVDTWGEATADAVITACEIQQITVRQARLYAISMDADEAIGLMVTMLRRGPDSVSLKRRMVERGIRLAADGEGATAA